MGEDRARSTAPARAGLFVALVVSYVALARLGLALDPNGVATLVWTPSGLALAALIIGGYHLAAAVAIGAFVTNLWVLNAPLVALGITAGNTLEAITGAYLLQRIPGFRPSLDRFADVIGLVVTALLLSTVVGATIGATVKPRRRIWYAW